MAVGAADVLRDWVAFVVAVEGFRAGVGVPDASFLGGSFGGLRFSSVPSALAVAAEGLRRAVEGLRSVLAASVSSSVCFGGCFAGCFFGFESVGLVCAVDSSDLGLGGSLAGCFLGVSVLVSFAGCFGGSFLGACFSGAFPSPVAAGVEVVAGAFNWVGFAVEAAVFFWATEVF